MKLHVSLSFQEDRNNELIWRAWSLSIYNNGFGVYAPCTPILDSIKAAYKRIEGHAYISALGVIRALYCTEIISYSSCVCPRKCYCQGYTFANRVTTFCVSRRRRKMYCGHARLCVCVSVHVYVCLFVRGRTPTQLHGPRCNLGSW